jgi:ABC-type ATPase involved in cell division
MIHFDDVSKTYPDDSTALEEVSFVIEPKEFVSIVGHSGAGKTTLLKMFLVKFRNTTSCDTRISTNQLPQVRKLVTAFLDFSYKSRNPG